MKRRDDTRQRKGETKQGSERQRRNKTGKGRQDTTGKGRFETLKGKNETRQ